MQVNIVMEDGYIRITGNPVVPADLKAGLSYWHRESVQSGYQRSMVSVKRECFTLQTSVEEVGACEVMIAMPGHAGRIKRILASAGVPFRMQDRRTPFPEPNIPLALQGMWDSQLEGVYTALKSGGGTIAAATGFGKTRVIAAIIRAFDYGSLQARGTPISLVTTKDQDICRQNYNVMKELFPDRDVGIIMSGKTKRSDDIQIVTLDSLHKVNMAEVGVMVVDEVHEAATSSRSDLLANAIYARRWGASATPDGRFDGSDLVTEGLVGPVIYRYTYQDGVRDGVLVPNDVYWLQVPKPDLAKYAYYIELKDRLARYRHAVEQNPDQCAMVQEIITRTPVQRQLLCIMQHVNQMNQLAPNLPGMPYVHAVTTEAVLLKNNNTNLSPIKTKERKALYQKIRDGDIRKVMSTYVYKQGVDFPQLDVMIQAGGGGSKIASAQIPGRASRTSEGKDRAYLVDFWHAWDKKINDDNELIDGPVLRDDKARRRVYRKLGFGEHVIGSVDELPFLSGNGGQLPLPGV